MAKLIPINKLQKSPQLTKFLKRTFIEKARRSTEQLAIKRHYQLIRRPFRALHS